MHEQLDNRYDGCDPSASLGWGLLFAMVIAGFPAVGTAGETTKIAVMPIQDKSGKLDKDTVVAATTYLRSGITASERFVVIARQRQNARLSELIEKKKKQSYRACYDKQCQIPLGRKLAADSILRSEITFFGSCILSVEVIDLAKEAAVVGAREDFECGIEGLRDAIDTSLTKVNRDAKSGEDRGATSSRESGRKLVEFASEPDSEDAASAPDPQQPTDSTKAFEQQPSDKPASGARASQKTVPTQMPVAKHPLDIMTYGAFNFGSKTSVTKNVGDSTEVIERRISMMPGMGTEIDYRIGRIVEVGARTDFHVFSLGGWSGAQPVIFNLEPIVKLNYRQSNNAVYLGGGVGLSVLQGFEEQGLELNTTYSWNALGVVGWKWYFSDSFGMFGETVFQYQSAPYTGRETGGAASAVPEYDLSFATVGFNMGFVF